MGMTLQAAYPLMEMAIVNAFQTAKEKIALGADSGDVDAINIQLAKDIAAAVHEYTTQAVVQSFVNTAVVGVGGGVPGPMVGTGLGVGNGKLL
tara:strand:+ start:2888 stop:3166 length:279 start_codon:yes stop_codon:yes gene_type:complete